MAELAGTNAIVLILVAKRKDIMFKSRFIYVIVSFLCSFKSNSSYISAT